MLGAACPASGEAVGLLAPNLSMQTVNAFFSEFSKEIDPDVHVVMIWDQAGFHTSKSLEVAENVTLSWSAAIQPETEPD